MTSQIPRVTNLFKAWYLELFAFFSLRFELNPLHGGLKKTNQGGPWPARSNRARRSAGSTSRQPAGGGWPWKAA